MQLFQWSRKRSNNTHRRGQGIVEFALVLPVFLIFVLGIMEFGRLLFIYAATQTASREGSRFGAATENLGKCSNIRDATKRLAFLTGISDSNIAVYYNNDPEDDTEFTCSSVGICPTSGSGSYLKGATDRIVVQVALRYEPIIPIPGISGVCFESKSARTLLDAIQVNPTPTPIPNP